MNPLNLLLPLFCLISLVTCTPDAHLGNLHVLSHETFELSNPHRANASLKFSITGVNVTRVARGKYDHMWSFSLLNFQEKIKLYEYPGFRANITDYTFHWDMEVEDLDDLPDQVEVCFHYGANSASWFSTYEERDQSWPMDTRKSIPQATSFQTGEFFREQFGPVIEYLFLNSDGFALMLSDHEPFRVRRDPNHGDPLLCVSLEKRFKFSFRFNLLATSDIRWTYHNITHGHSYIKLLKPDGLPDERLFRDPIWSTWVQYKTDVNQAKVLDFANQIKKHGFPASHIEIDDRWERHYGDLEFDKSKFPDPKKLVQEIHKLGFRVSLWVHPFVNQDSLVFQNGSNFLAKDKHATVLQTNWWNGNRSGIIDFSDRHAVDWFVRRLEALRNETGIDSFKFDAGEAGYYGRDVHFSGWETRRHPDMIARQYVEAAQRLGPAGEVRVGYKSQNIPLFVRLLDRGSHWGADNGLRSIIPAVLTLSIAGYPFILPDMIGGNQKPTDELYIRWVQVNTFLPAMQFSIRRGASTVPR